MPEPRTGAALAILGTELLKEMGAEQLVKLTEMFEGSIEDVAAKLFDKGYSKGFENTADEAAVRILQRVGYDPYGLVDVLETLKEKGKSGGKGFLKTHPGHDARIKNVRALAGERKSLAASKIREARFKKKLMERL